MSAMRTTTQAEIDAALLKELGIKPTGKFTKDKTQQLYVDPAGKGLMLPASVEGYSYYSAGHIVSHARKRFSELNVIDTRCYEVRPDLKAVETKSDPAKN